MQMISRFIATALTILISATPVVSQTAASQSTAPQSTGSSLWGSLDAGPYGVGFEVAFGMDEDRAFGTGSAGRPIRLFVWYPTLRDEVSGRSANLRFGDYLDVRAPSAGLEPYNEMLRERDLDVARRQFSPVSEEHFQALLAAPARARLAASPSPGRFPLVVHVLGRNDFQQESTVLWEHLASHGYVVAVVPQVGPDPESLRMPFSAEALALQVEDLEFAIRVARRLEFVHPSKLALIGHSSGAIVAALQARSGGVHALVSLDGSITHEDGREVAEAAGWDFSSLELPVLDLYAAGKGGLDLTLLDQMPGADRFHVALGAGRPPSLAVHFDFQNWPLYEEWSGVPDDRMAEVRPLGTGARYFRTATRLTRHFLDGVFWSSDEGWALVRGDQTLPEISPDEIQFRVDAAREGRGSF
jgi:dienelactone hydrolase